jgi:F0F1-type ATP synthase assembly protein I
MQTSVLVQWVADRIDPSSERGAIGWLTIGIIIGVLLVVGGTIKFLIPGD